jgi:hypothetical protein
LEKKWKLIIKFGSFFIRQNKYSRLFILEGNVVLTLINIHEKSLIFNLWHFAHWKYCFNRHFFNKKMRLKFSNFINIYKESLSKFRTFDVPHFMSLNQKLIVLTVIFLCYHAFRDNLVCAFSCDFVFASDLKNKKLIFIYS